MYSFYVLLAGILAGMLIRPTINLLLKKRIKDYMETKTKKTTLVLCLSNAIGWFIIYEIFGFSFNFIFTSFVVTIAIILSVIDIKIRKIPNEVLLLMLGVSVVLHMVKAESIPLDSHFKGLLTGLGLFLLGDIISGKGKVGSGDIKLAASIGFMTGFPLVLPVLLISSVTVSVIGGLMIICKKITRDKPIPYAPFMMTGLIIGLILNAPKITKLKFMMEQLL